MRRAVRPGGSITALVFLVLGLGLAPAGCKRTNDSYCCTTQEACDRPGGSGVITACADPDRPFCDNDGTYAASNGVGRTCIALPGAPCDGQGADGSCTDPGAPICFDGTCVGCAGPSDCGPDAPVCGELDHTCAGCTQSSDCAGFSDRSTCDNGVCVGCRDSGDCGVDAPVCDGDQHVCRACEAGGECDSGVCDLGGGACVAAGDILHVAPGGADSGDCGASPCQTIGYAVGQVAGARMWIQIAPGDYQENPGLVVDGKTVRLVGPGATMASLKPTAIDTPALQVLHQSDVEVDGLTLHQASGASGYGLGCSLVSGPTRPTVVLRQVTLEDNQEGAFAQACNLDIERSTLVHNTGGGLEVTSGIITVLNSFITVNGSSISRLGGIRAVLDDGSRIEHVTLTGNTAQDGLAFGLICDGGVALRNNIIYGNGGDAVAQVSGNCSHTYSVIGPRAVAGKGNIMDPPSFVDPDPVTVDAHLQAGIERHRRGPRQRREGQRQRRPAAGGRRRRHRRRRVRPGQLSPGGPGSARGGDGSPSAAARHRVGGGYRCASGVRRRTSGSTTPPAASWAWLYCERT